MKRKKLFIIFGVNLVFLILALWIFGAFSSLSLINVGGEPLETKTFTFVGVEGIAEAPIFGSTKNNPTTKTYEYVYDGSGDPPARIVTYHRFDFCGSNDADVSISNSLSDGQTLSLSSSMNSNKQPCSQTNGINTKQITIPAGKFSGTCTVSASEGNDGKSVSSCAVAGFSLSAVWNTDCNRGEENINAAYWGANCQSPKTQTFEKIFDKPTTITAQISTIVGNTGSASASLTLNYKEIDLCEGINCSDYCEDSVKKYNGHCVNGECIYQTQTCPLTQKCENGECILIEPPQPELSGFAQFFVNIWNWIRELF